MKNTSSLFAIALAAFAGWQPLAVYADAISPSIKETNKVYSKEKPDVSFYGTGIGGRQMEASVLRLEVDRLMQDAEYDRALVKIKKAVQLDPSYPEGHLMLARVLTKKLQTTDGPPDEKILSQAIYEWRLIWLHDADNIDQSEAKFNCLRLMKVAHGIARQKKQEEKAREKAKHELAMQRAREQKELEKTLRQDATAPVKQSIDGAQAQAATAGASVLAGQTQIVPPAQGVTSGAPSPAAQPAAPVRVAQKKKRFLLF
jgi:hypothetical protein